MPKYFTLDLKSKSQEREKGAYNIRLTDLATPENRYFLDYETGKTPLEFVFFGLAPYLGRDFAPGDPFAIEVKSAYYLEQIKKPKKNEFKLFAHVNELIPDGEFLGMEFRIGSHSWNAPYFKFNPNAYLRIRGKEDLFRQWQKFEPATIEFLAIE